jgi:hypothetical protein
MSGDTAPAGLPVLSPGGHLAPDDGACLMEYVSVLAGERWSDRPGCTDPTLAAVARAINDEVSDDGRAGLAGRAADLVGRSGHRGRLAPAIVAACVRVALDRLDRPVRALERQRDRAVRRLAAHGRATGRLRAAALAELYARGPARHAVASAVLALRRLPADRRDRALLAMLDAAIAASGPAASRPAASRPAAPVPAPVRVS